jgi:hypothetical protein
MKVTSFQSVAACAAARMAASKGSAPPSELASAAIARTCASSNPGSARQAVTASSLRVRVPVLSAQRTSIPAASSSAESRVGNTPRFATARAPTVAARGEHRRQRHRNRCQHGNQHQRRDLGKRHGQVDAIRGEQDGHGAIEQREIAHDAKNRLLLGAFDMSGADEFRAAAEFRARAGGDDFGHRLAPPDQRAGIGCKTGPRLDRHGFASEHRLVDQNGAVDQPNVSRNDGAERQLDHVALHQFGRWQRFPDAVAPRRCGQRQAGFQRVECRLGAALLEKSQADIEQQENCDGGGFKIFAEPQLQQDRRFEHPRNRCP